MNSSPIVPGFQWGLSASKSMFIDPHKTRMLTYMVPHIPVTTLWADAQIEKERQALSSTAEGQTLRETALNGLHRRLGAKMVDFGGWDMPVEYPSSGGLVKEHLAVRTGVGMVDVSPLGDALIRRPPALA